MGDMLLCFLVKGLSGKNKSEYVTLLVLPLLSLSILFLALAGLETHVVAQAGFKFNVILLLQLP